MPPIIPDPTHKLSPEQQYEFDVNGYIVLRKHYDADTVAQLHEGIDELQAIPVDYDTYRKIGVASYYLAPAMEDPAHDFWNGKHPEASRETAGVWKVEHAICGTDKFDVIVRDPILEDIHSALAWSTIFVSATYYIEKIGPAPPGGLHNGGSPPDRHIYYAYDRANQQFNCCSTKSVVTPSDMSEVMNPSTKARASRYKSERRTSFSSRVIVDWLPRSGPERGSRSQAALTPGSWRKSSQSTASS